MVDTFQDSGHPEGWDYEAGSPHLKHRDLNRWMRDTLRAVVTEKMAENGSLHVLEVGAGHGLFTDDLLAAGAEVTVTEMSQASARFLCDRYKYNSSATIIHDPDGDSAALADLKFDLVLCIAVLHHIPDYLAAIYRWVARLTPGGTFISFQDPLWYPRQPKTTRQFERASYYIWRLGQGDLKAGIASFNRRRGNTMEDDNPRDMVEYHVLRDGCDEEAIVQYLSQHFSRVEVLRYWSTQSRTLQMLGQRLNVTSEFGIIARQR